MEQSAKPGIINNFDLIRLLAALQVVFRHLFYKVDFHNAILNFIKSIILSFPGVPVFFTVSGFLIYWSFDRNSGNHKKYFKNRFLRIYPALWVCFIFTVMVLFFEDREGVIAKDIEVFLVWSAGQVTFVQFWTPQFLKFWGEGAPNASLWTIFVELQFYFFVPVFYFILKKFWRYKAIVLLLVFLASVFFNMWVSTFGREDVIYKLGSVSVLNYLFYFLYGVFFYIYWDKIKTLIQGKALFWLPVFLMSYLYFHDKIDIELNDYYLHSPVKLVFITLLDIAIMSLAYSYNTVAENLLRRQDISYGIYIYHMVVINFFIQHGWIHQKWSAMVIFIITILLAALSWFLVEKKILNLKKKAV